MRKSIVSPAGGPFHPSSSIQWFDLEQAASVELSSEDPEHPFENALRSRSDDGWSAAAPGPQLIRLHFDTPQTIRHIHLEFREDKLQRSQEFAIYAISSETDRKEIVRQQWTFSPGTAEVEDYSVNLLAVKALEFQIDPGRHDRQAIASLYSLAVA